jgi:hypothetical protein
MISFSGAIITPKQANRENQVNTTIKPKRDPELEVNTLPDGHIVVFNARTNLACTLTPLAALVWEFCDGSNSLEEIVQQLDSIEDLPKVQSMKVDVEKLVQEFEDSGLVLFDD